MGGEREIEKGKDSSSFQLWDKEPFSSIEEEAPWASNSFSFARENLSHLLLLRGFLSSFFFLSATTVTFTACYFRTQWRMQIFINWFLSFSHFWGLVNAHKFQYCFVHLHAVWKCNPNFVCTPHSFRLFPCIPRVKWGGFRQKQMRSSTRQICLNMSSITCTTVCQMFLLPYISTVPGFLQLQDCGQRQDKTH